MGKKFYWKVWPTFIFGVFLCSASPVRGQTNNYYQIFVSNEKSGDITVISGLSRQSGAAVDGDFKVIATIPAGKRPRGIHGSPDGKISCVALSGTPIEAPPKLDANGNPVF